MISKQFQKTLILLSLIVLTFSVKSQVYSMQWQIPVLNPKSMIVDSIGNSYVVDGNLIKKYNSAGNFVWQNTAIGTVPVVLKFDHAGNIVAAGTKTNSAGSLNDFFVCKLSTGGATLWSHTIDSLNLDNNLAAFEIDKYDNVILAGTTLFSPTNSDVTWFNLTPSGLWNGGNYYSSAPGDILDNTCFVTLDSLCNVHITLTAKTSTNTAPIDSMAIVKFTPVTNFFTLKYFKGNPALPVNSITHATIYNNRIYVYYRYASNLPGYVSAVSNFDTTLTNVVEGPITGYGPPVYQKQITVTDVKSYDKKNVLFIAGLQTNVLSSSGPSVYYPFACNIFTAYTTAQGISNGILLNNNNYVYSFSEGSTFSLHFFLLNPLCGITQTITIKPYSPGNTTSVFGLESDLHNSIYLLSTNNSGSFLEKYAFPDGIKENSLNDKFQLYPNPSTGKIIIRSETIIDKIEVEIITALGQTIYSNKVYSNNYIDISDKPAGVYFINIKTPEGSITKKFIKD
jgi:hypothetical protein